VRSSISIDVAAPAEAIFELARDVSHWRRLLPHYVRSRVLSRDTEGRAVVSFVAVRPVLGSARAGLPVVWRARCWSEPETLRLRFVHLAGATRGMDVTWRLEPTSTGCRVTIEHDFRPRIAAWAGFVDRWFTRAIAGRTLARFKALVEAAEAPKRRPGPAETSAGAGATNPSA
jgi:ribosome-associated toxin RatA of RatAB toxin-antitoxin module